MANIKLTGVSKIYPGDVVAVENFNLDIDDKEFIVFVGPSGCGKSTTLRMIAGLEDITMGEIFIGDTLVNNVQPKDRDIAMVFQSYALYPHMTVYKNMAFSLKMRKTPKDIIDDKVKKTAALLGISHLLERKPRALSGGERQRVALGRAMVRDPKAFLLDEPLSNLDAKLRSDMRAEIIKLHKELETTFVYVTHDQTEAMTMGDRIVIMDKGHILQVDTPENIYSRPKNLFVAGFIGSPQMNFINGTIDKSRNSVVLETGDVISLEGANIKDHETIDNLNIVLGIRPEHIVLSAEEVKGFTFKNATIEFSEMLGAESYVHLTLGGQRIITRISAMVSFQRGSKVNLQIKSDKIHIFNAETGDAITSADHFLGIDI